MKPFQSAELIELVAAGNDNFSSDLSVRNNFWTFASGSLLDLDFQSGTQAGTWTIMSAADGIVDEGLAFAAGVDTDVWSFAVVGNDLQITVVPESSAFALIMGAGALLLIGGRRRRYTLSSPSHTLWGHSAHRSMHGFFTKA